MKTKVLFVLMGLMLLTCSPQPETQALDSIVDTLNPACDFSEAHEFDFWIGDWDLTWADTGVGTNNVRRILNGCVVQESFNGMGFRGISVSAYDQQTQRWKQTWVDNSGGYLDFSGGWEGDRMILSRTFKRNDKPITQRMVWHNISSDTLDWNWEVSQDSGETWRVLWRIDYTRRLED